MIGPLGALYGVVKQGVRMVQGYRLVPMAWVVATAAFAGEYVKPPLPPEATFPSGKVVKVTETGAVADGTTLASEAIAKAIEQCAAAGGLWSFRNVCKNKRTRTRIQLRRCT
jgi:polygalacturonase